MLRTVVATVSIAMFQVASGEAVDPGEIMEYPGEIRAQFNGSRDLPTGIAFQGFLRLLESETKAGQLGGEDPRILTLMVTALGDHVVPILEERIQLFRDTYQSLSSEKRAVRYRMLCSDERNTRSQQRTYDLLNEIDDVQELIAEKHYMLLASNLSTDEKKAFQNFLDDSKEGISYTKIDQRGYFQTHQLDVRSAVDTRCIQLAQTIPQGGDLQ